MNSVKYVLWLLLLSSSSAPLFASTWYVRPDGGTRYTAGMNKGQCDGTADAPYPGSGTNRHCAFKDVRSFWTDGSYAGGNQFPSWAWIGKGGDTYLIRGSLGSHVSYRVGWPNAATANDPSSGLFFGVAGDPYQPAMPPPLSGTASQHTRILGENYESCHADSAKTQLHGGFGVGAVIPMSGVSYVDVACLDITDFSDCGRSGQAKACNTSIGSLSDFASTGISWSNKSNNDTITDVHIHGLAGSGMTGPTGDGIVMRYVDVIGNAAAGWNADPGDGTTGNGSLLVEHYNISWNGCAEEYPVVDPLPYKDCVDDNGGGYGDGFGTTSKDSHPGWHVVFDQGVVSYNTQDGLDALHISGEGSSMTVSHTLAYGNMGQQIKVGGAAGILTDNQIVTNCNAMRQKIPGTPAGYNVKLSDFCRAADTGIAVGVNDTVPLRMDSNVIYSATITGIEIDCGEAHCGSSTRIDFRNNIFLGFKNSGPNGYPDGGRGDYSNLVYLAPGLDPFKNAGSVVSGNVAYYPHSGGKCFAESETKSVCKDPHLTDETWHVYGYGDMTPNPNAVATADDVSITEEAPMEGSRSLRRPSRTRAAECFGIGVLALAVWRGVRSRRGRRTL